MGQELHVGIVEDERRKVGIEDHGQEEAAQLGKPRTLALSNLHSGSRNGNPEVMSEGERTRLSEKCLLAREIVLRSSDLAAVCGRRCYASGSSAEHLTAHTYYPP